MALLSPAPAITESVHSLRIRDIGVAGTMARSSEIVEGPPAGLTNDTIYVAVSAEVKECKSILMWAIENYGLHRICILHVHVPAQMIPLMGTKFAASALKEQEVAAYREIERQAMCKRLGDYLLICKRNKVPAEKLYLEMDCIEKGIVELISRNGIQNLVMGAASDRHFRKMTDLRSKKAIYVREHAPPYCCIKFVSKGSLLQARVASVDASALGVSLPLLQELSYSDSGQSHPMRSVTTKLPSNRPKLSSPAEVFLRRVKTARESLLFPVSSADDIQVLSTLDAKLLRTATSSESERPSRVSPRTISTSLFDGAVEATPVTNVIAERSGYLPASSTNLNRKVDPGSSLPSELDRDIDDVLSDQLEQVRSEAENARTDAFRQSVRRGRAEKDAIEAIRRVKVSEALYAVELRMRKEVEQALEKEREELEKLKGQRDEVKEELQLALEEKASLESQVAASEQMVEDLKHKMLSGVDLLQNYKKERDELQIQRDSALREAEELRKQGEASCTHMPQFFSDFYFSEIVEATRNFDSSLKIGEGGYGSIYRGSLRHTEVAIKILHTNSLQGPSEFKQEVDVLSKLRHPNLITLIGACPESWILVYEYLPNGSLEDRLNCRDNSPPLSWQTRIRIATELCSALIFLHSCKPHCIVHGDLKPANILLDANMVSKLSDFGICRVLSRNDRTSSNNTLCRRTDPKGTFVYMDPEFLASGELTPKSDIYSLGIILLRLLTGRHALGIMKEVQYALDTGRLNSILDPLAGGWPYVQAEHLTRLALRCCDMNRKSRPDLTSEIWRILEPLRASCGCASSFQLTSEILCQPPPYFICPIFQEVMRDPHVAADGYTYEAEAIRGWLESGHDTSPMTNAKLAHRNLLTNHALRSAIQEWLQHH